MGTSDSFGQRRRATAWEAVAGRRAPAMYRMAEEPEELTPNVLYRFVQGVDPAPQKMAEEQVLKLGDPWAAVLHQGDFPLVLSDVMSRVDAGQSVPVVESYLVGEAGQIPPDVAPELFRDFRFAIVRKNTKGAADLMISTSALDGSIEAFLQIAAWDAPAGLFNYYMRLGSTWVWTGDSFSALAPESRGRGCFDSHVNGSLVMKELAQPWMHWQSQNAQIQLAPQSPVRDSPYYGQKFLQGAEQLELTVRAAVDRWTTARLSHVTSHGALEHPDWLVRQLCTTTTVNIATSPNEFRTLSTLESFAPPLGLWLNTEALLDTLGLPVDITLPDMPANLYLDCVQQYGFALEAEGYRQAGDSFFAFAVPVPGLEDQNVIDHLVRDGVLTPRFVACVLMVDFVNPIFSSRRAALLTYCPTSPFPLDGADDLSAAMARSITAAAAELPPGSPEAEFATNWQVAEADWPTVFAQRIEDYFRHLVTRLTTPDGVDDYVRLAESRRREFKTMKLNEFSLTLPVTTIPADAPLLDMHPDGTVGAKTPISTGAGPSPAFRESVPGAASRPRTTRKDT